MAFWTHDISVIKVLKASAIFTIFAYITHQIEAILTMRYYLMPEYFGVWSKLMMPGEGPPPLEFMITSLVLTFVTGVSIALIYYYLRSHLPENPTKRIFYFADLLIATSFVFSTLPIYLMLNVPHPLLLCWFISNFVIVTFGSWVMVKIIR